MKKYMLFLFILLTTTTLINTADYTKDREKMVRYQIEERGVIDVKVLDAMRSVPRHQFVPDNQKNNAYEDRPLPIGYGQTISQPYIVALMTELLGLTGREKVLEIGTGSGYQAAILSQIVEEVYTVEIYEELASQAEKRFHRLNYNNIHVKWADGYYGWKDYSQYDAIIVTCAPTFVPPPLIEQLKVGGKLVIPVGPPFTVQKLLLLTKVNEEKVITRVITGVIFVPLIREAK